MAIRRRITGKQAASPYQRDTDLTITVYAISGRSETIRVQPNNWIYTLEPTFQPRHTFADYIWGDTLLDRKRTFNYYSIPNGAELHLVFKPDPQDYIEEALFMDLDEHGGWTKEVRDTYVAIGWDHVPPAKEWMRVTLKDFENDRTLETVLVEEGEEIWEVMNDGWGAREMNWMRYYFNGVELSSFSTWRDSGIQDGAVVHVQCNWYEGS